MRRLLNDDIVGEVFVQQSCCAELNRISIDGHNNLPLDSDTLRLVIRLHKTAVFPPVLRVESITCQQ